MLKQHLLKGLFLVKFRGLLLPSFRNFQLVVGKGDPLATGMRLCDEPFVRKRRLRRGLVVLRHGCVVFNSPWRIIKAVVGHPLIISPGLILKYKAKAK